MAVLLRRTVEVPAEGWDSWAGVAGTDVSLDLGRRAPGLADRLERAFDYIAPDWLALARTLGEIPSASLAHAPSAAPNASDLGLMMAWTVLVDDWAAGAAIVLVVCDDPWMFRHLAARAGVGAGSPPPLAPLAVKRALRGQAARLKYALGAACAALRLGAERRRLPRSMAAILVYGHPRSAVDGADAYFGDLMARLPHLHRLLHVDAGPERVAKLASDRTASLHGWGNPLFALARLPFARWRPAAAHLEGPHGMLVRRAASLEAATAQGAAVAWQCHCQTRWLEAAKPQVVAWPWENHGWERAFVRAARQRGISTLGYQHSVVGRQMLNYAAGSNADGPASLPDRVLCSGGATRDQLASWGFPIEHLAIGGALRFAGVGQVVHDPAAPVFVALPFDQGTAAEMVDAARRVGRATDRRFVVKDHPMTPFAFADGDGITRTTVPLGEQHAVSAVLYAATTVGLEAVLMGLPTARFRPTGRIALDILPANLAVPSASSETLTDVLGKLSAAKPMVAGAVFAPVDFALWETMLPARQYRSTP